MATAPPPGRPPGDVEAHYVPTIHPSSAPQHFKNRKRRSPWRWVWRGAAVVVVVAMLLVATSVVGAVTTPGNTSFTAKWADWLRAHHASTVANQLEQWYYDAKAPSPGGRPTKLNAIPPADPSSSPVASPLDVNLAPPPPVPLVVVPGLSGEGQWHATGPVVGGSPAMYVAQFRADTVYTSQITTAVWIDPHRLRIRLVPGAQEPGGSWPQAPDLSGTAEAQAVAAFNGGFRFQDAKGGFYLDGRTAVALRPGASSVVIHSDGTMDIGTWNQEVSMTPSVEAVLQNLAPLVDGGVVAPAAQSDNERVWGFTLGASTIVARSGIGITASGALVYVAGPALSVRTLAEALQRAGAVRAMTLDINPEWVTFNLYAHPSPSDPTQVSATKLYPQMARPATRYLGPTRESRDFFSVSLP